MKNIVICCDGTGQEFGARNTNVVKLFELLEKEPATQITYYDPGVGTRSAPGLFTSTAKKLSLLFGLAFAYGLVDNVEAAYRFLMNHYEDGDRVYLFGFSRGAYTVRALAGLLKNCGLLQPGSVNLVPYASKMYLQNTPSLATEFKKTFSRECPVHFLGVWDTVKSVGLLHNPRFRNTVGGTGAKFARQALAIDEKRWHYQPCKLNHPRGTDVMNVWFAGVHSDIGGGYADSALSKTPLIWLVKEAFDKGLKVTNDAFATIKSEPTAKRHNSLVPCWWILGWKTRFIYDKAKIHSSVRKRMALDPSYRPANLLSADGVEYIDDLVTHRNEEFPPARSDAPTIESEGI